MSLQEQLKSEWKTAMLAKDKARVGTIRLLMAEIKQKEVDTRTVLNDEEIIAVLTKMVKQRKDSIAAFEGAGRTELAEVEKAESEVLKVYLPARMSEAEVTAAVQAIVARLGASGAADMGKVMGVVKTELAGKADMGQVSLAVKAALQ